jgi:hypothetical protein
MKMIEAANVIRTANQKARNLEQELLVEAPESARPFFDRLAGLEGNALAALKRYQRIGKTTDTVAKMDRAVAREVYVSSAKRMKNIVNAMDMLLEEGAI